MPYVFSTVIDNVNLHIRITPKLFMEERLKDELPHKHFFIEFHYIYSGEVRLLFPQQEKTVSLRAGDIAVIPDGFYHRPDTDGKIVRLCFNFSMEAEENPQNPIYRIFRSLKEVRVFSSSFIRDSMQRYRRIMEDEKDPCRETRGGIILLDIILEIFRHLSEGMRLSGKSHNKLRQKWIIEEYIFNKYFLPDGIKGLSAALYLSERQTRKLVRQFYGEDYKTLIVRQRMEMAQLLLRSDDLPLAIIAEKVGYRSYSGFHLAFVKSIGITPAECRKKQKNEPSAEK